MVFGFFKKKKPQPGQPGQPGTQPTTQPNTSPPKTKEKSPQKHKSGSSREHSTFVSRIAEEDRWMYDAVVQFLSSPSWRIPILTFIDDNCIIFDDEEENKFEYTTAHNAFKKMIEGLVEDMLCELEITEEKLMEVLQEGVKDPEFKRIFEQLLIIDNFLVFKNLMLKRNKELELEALQQLQEIDSGKMNNSIQYAPPQDNTGRYPDVNAPVPKDIQKLILEKEQAEITHAIALSLAIEQEKVKLLEQEDYELQEALKQSQQLYNKEQELEKSKLAQKKLEEERMKKLELEQQRKSEQEKQKQAEQQEKSKQAEQQEKAKQVEQQEKQEKQEKAKQIDQEKEKLRQSEKEKELAKLAQIQAHAQAQKKAALEEQIKLTESVVVSQKVVEEQKVEDQAQLGGDSSVKTSKKLEPIKGNVTKHLPPLVEETKTSSLPPLKGNNKFDPLSVEQLQEEKNKIDSKLQQMKADSNQSETLEERKARLKAQRDLILAKKKAERQAELENYEAQKGKTTENKEPKLSEAEAAKRKEVYEKLKGEL